MEYIKSSSSSFFNALLISWSDWSSTIINEAKPWNVRGEKEGRHSLWNRSDCSTRFPPWSGSRWVRCSSSITITPIFIRSSKLQGLALAPSMMKDLMMTLNVVFFDIRWTSCRISRSIAFLINKQQAASWITRDYIQMSWWSHIFAQGQWKKYNWCASLRSIIDDISSIDLKHDCRWRRRRSSHLSWKSSPSIDFHSDNQWQMSISTRLESNNGGRYSSLSERSRSDQTSLENVPRWTNRCRRGLFN